jgi:type IX secretion system PorP/SprF family membrane protein
MKKLYQLLLALLVSGSAFAQQKPQYSQYMFNNYLLNPAVTGIEDHIDLKLGVRKQWAGLKGAPTTYYASIHGAVGKVDRNAVSPFRTKQKKGAARQAPVKKRVRVKPKMHHGFGTMIQADKTGPLSVSSLHGSYAVHVPLTKTLKVSTGLSAGILQYSLDATNLLLTNPNDAAIGDGRINRIIPDLNAGMWLYTGDYYLGVAASQLLKNKVNFGDNDFRRAGTLQSHYFLTGGGRVPLSENFTLIPTVMVKYAQPSPVALDVNLKAVFRDQFWGGVSFRQRDAVSVMAGMNIDQLVDVGYSYDVTTSALSRVSSGSHELMIGLRLNNKFKGSPYLPWW